MTTKPREKHGILDTEILAFLDEDLWICPFVVRVLGGRKENFLRLPSTTEIRSSWGRFKLAPRIIMHWESQKRRGGTLIEEILDVAPHFDVAERIIVLTTNPTHEDVVYFSELGVRRIIQIRNSEAALKVAAREVIGHLSTPPDRSATERTWRRLLISIDALPPNPNKEIIANLSTNLEKINTKSNDPVTARYLEARATLTALAGRSDEARAYWEKTIEKNPKYYRAYNSLTKHLRSIGEHKSAFALMQKMQELNKSNISRLIAMGELHMDLADDEKAEHYFKSALERDQRSAGALNGLAEILFKKGDFEKSRALLAKSHKPDRAASKLNSMGIGMVRRREYAKALEHYSKAQYVLPQQEKGPMLFYNIGLCYYRWGKLDLASEYLRIALIKEPAYKKANDLLMSIQTIASADHATQQSAH